ncbi:hypothetical protein MY5147_009463 [Beauveria neobassiana]
MMLRSNADWSWICKDGEKHINWLRDPDMLPAQVPKARIIVYRYESTWHVDAPKTRLQLCGEELVHSLHAFRAGRPSRPLVFVGHSLGGNVIVQAFLYASDDSRYESLLKTTVGLVFLGTPFRGSKWQPLADALAQLMGPAGSHSGITRELGFDEPALRDRVHRFCKLLNKLSTAVACFSELHETDYGRRLGIVGVAKGMVVDETSACIPGLDRYALDKDHLKINKYYGPTDPAFERVSDVISKMCRRANDVVRRRFERKEIITDNHAALKYSPQAEACLHDLFVTDPLEDKKALKRKKGDRAAGTCEWILGTDDLTAWLGPSHNENSEIHATQVLWLHGNPGTGKSTLAIYLTDVLSTGFSATDGNTMAYFFCDSAFDTRRTATSVVRGLLLQLIQQHPLLLSYVLPKYNERKAKLFESFDALWTIFISAAADRNTGRKYCIIDALDECDDESQRTLLRQLQETFHSSDAPPNVRILVTSRPYPEIRKHLDIFTHKDLASFPDIKQDIDRCIKERVAQLKYTEKIKGRVTEILRDKAEGTFLWVGIACTELEDIPSKDAISCLEAMPSGLHALYEKLFSAALEKEREKGTIRLVLGFVAVSQRPLTLLELSEACRLRQDEDDIETRTQFMREYIESCRLMVVIQDEKVLLLHQSVKDYLVKLGEKARFSEFQAQADLAYRCLDHLIQRFRTTKNTYDHFSDYATLEWPNHARMAQSKFVVLDSHAEFFEVISACRETWLTPYRHRQLEKFGFNEPPHQYSILHVAAQWGIPAIVEHVYSSNGNDEAAELTHLTDASHQIPLEYAVASGYPAVVRILLGLGSSIPETAILNAVANRKSGQEMTALLLEQRGEEIRITEEVVKAAAGNGWNGKEIMALLLERRGEEVGITEEVVKAATGNWGNGKEVMTLLLKQREREIRITDEVVKAAAGNWDNGKEVMALLLEQRGEEIQITEDVVKAVAGNGRNGKEIMALLLEQRGEKIRITEEVVKATAGNRKSAKEVMALLMEWRGEEIQITEEVAKAAARNLENGKEVMALLLKQRGEEVRITEEVVKAAAENWGNGKEMMTLLLEQRGGEIQITEEVVKAAARNLQHGEVVMELLLEQRGGEIQITEEVVKAAAGNGLNGKEVMALLLERRGGQIIITEEVVKAAAGNRRDGKEVMAILFEQRGDEIMITEEVVKAAAENEGNGKEVMALLLERRGGEVRITEEVVKAAAGNGLNGKEVMALLLERRGKQIIITEEVVKAAAGNRRDGKEVMAILFEQRGDEIMITEEVVKAAAENEGNGKEVMALLLERRGEQIIITEEVVKAAAGNWRDGKEVMAILLEQRGDEITITEEVVKAAAGNEGNGQQILQLLFDRRREEAAASVTDMTLLTAATCGQDGVLDLVSRQNGLIPANDEHRRVAKFYNAAKAGNARCVEQLIQEGAKPDLRNPRGITPLWIAAEEGHDAVVRILAQRLDVDVNSLSIAGRPPLFWPSNYGYEKVVAILLEAKADPGLVDENGDTAVTVARENGHENIAKVLERFQHLRKDENS